MDNATEDAGFEQDGPDPAAERLAAALHSGRETTGEAVQWFRNGDHPADDCHMIRPDPASLTQFAPFLSEGKVVRYFRHPDIPGTSSCPRCGQVMHDHGWIDQDADGITVCPGDWVAPDGNGGYRIAARLDPDTPLDEDGLVHAPFTADQVDSLNAFQRGGMMHPFTCPLDHPWLASRPSLLALAAGWTCAAKNPEGRFCGYTQGWAHSFMADWSWKPPDDAGPGEYRLQPSTLSAWRVTRESAELIAQWVHGAADDGTTVQVFVPTGGGRGITAYEGWWVIRYGTSAEGAGLYWAVPGDLFESSYVSTEAQ